MDLENIVQSLSHARAVENCYSDIHFENPMDDLQVQDSLINPCNISQEIDRNSDIIDLDDFKDILGDLNEDGMLDAYTSILYDSERNDESLITETKPLLDLNESNVVLRDPIVQDETEEDKKTDVFKKENVSLDNAGKIEIEIAPFSIEPSVKVYTTNESKTDSIGTSLPNFQDAFKMFVNVPFNAFAQENVREHNLLQYDEVNAEYSQKNTNNEGALKVTNMDITDEMDYDDITLVENQTETYNSILANNVKFLDNVIAIDDNFLQKPKANTTEYDSDCPGYHSSDFEFISESEEEMEGLITNDFKSEAKTNTINSENNNFDQNVTVKDYYRTRYEIYKDQEEKAKEHQIPEGEEYFNLFQGNNEATMSMYYMMENKSLGAISCMAIDYQGIGFDMRMMRRDDVEDDELKEEAKVTAERMLEMYPFENSKR